MKVLWFVCVITIVFSCVQRRSASQQFYDNGVLKSKSKHKVLENYRGQNVRKSSVIAYDSLGNKLSDTKRKRILKDQKEFRFKSYFSNGQLKSKTYRQSDFCGCFCNSSKEETKTYYANGKLKIRSQKKYKTYLVSKLIQEEQLEVYYPSGKLNKRVYFLDEADSISLHLRSPEGKVLVNKIYVEDTVVSSLIILDEEVDSTGTYYLN